MTVALGGVIGIVLLGMLGLGVALLLWGIGIYNRLVALRNQTDNEWSQIDVQLRKRFDLVPNLVETVKGYASHEKEVFQKVTEARASMANAQGVQQQAEAQNMLTSALKSLFAVAEAYPDLKANQNFMALQQELSAIEGEIARAREIYNDAVMALNTLIQTFPASFVAQLGGFTPRQYFPMEDAAREPVRVSFT